MFIKLSTFCLILLIAFTAGCRSCVRSSRPVAQIETRPIVIDEAEPSAAPPAQPKIENSVKHIEIRTERGGAEPAPAGEKPAEGVVEKMKKVTLPPDTYEETNLTARLREKMLDAYGGREDSVPDVTIYLSDMAYDEFVQHYKSLGYKARTIAIPAREVVAPALEQRPELAQKIDLSRYDGIVIHQVMLDEAGISAADRYIDPDTFEVVDKTFVTKMNK